MMAAAATELLLQNSSSGTSLAPTRYGPMPARRTKWSQFLTKSIITALPKVKCSVVPAGFATAESDLRAGMLNISALLSDRSHAGSTAGAPAASVEGGGSGGGGGISAAAAAAAGLTGAGCPAAAAAAACTAASSCASTVGLTAWLARNPASAAALGSSPPSWRPSTELAASLMELAASEAM